MSSATQNIKKHVTLLTFGTGNAVARVKDLIFLICKAQPALSGGAKSRTRDTERLENPQLTARCVRQHRCWVTCLYLFHMSCKIVGLYVVKHTVSSADGFGTWKALQG
jgi:hypothetical protein